ncbi:MAG: DNA polymerase III subunit delta [Neisseria sp.]|nr:DNA polymerase III subunit delta [Neisseria sp.]
MQITPEQLITAVQNPLAPLYMIHGEEELLRIEALDTLRAAAQAQGYLNREILTADAKFDWSQAFQAADSMGLFADKKLLEIHIPSGRPGKAGGDALVTLSERLHDETTIVIVLPKLEKAQTQSKWFAALSRAGDVIEARAVGTAALPAWIRQRLAKHDLTIDADALALFAERVEGNLLAARQEIDKLALLHPAGTVLHLEDAQHAVANVARFDVFQLSAAWMSGDLPRLLRLLESLEAEGEEPVLLLWAAGEDIRTLLRLRAALSQGQTVAQVRNPLRLWGEKQTLAPRALKRLSTRRLLDALQQCALADRQIKGAAQGSAWSTTKTLFSDLAR